MKSDLRCLRKICFSLFLIQCTILSFGQSPNLKTSADKKNILIGEQFQYEVEASFPANSYRLHWFTMPDSLPHFEVVNAGKLDSTESNGVLSCKQTITLTSFDSGTNTIPQFKIDFESLQNGAAVNLLTDSLQMNVSYSPLDSTKTFHDIKTIIDVTTEKPWWFWWAIVVAVLLIAGLIIFVIYYFRKNKAPEKIFQSKLPPYEEAMESLKELQATNLSTQEEVKRYHIRLSEIFKRYISRKMNMNLLNLTSNELLVKLNEDGTTKENISAMANSLRMSDAVKFAKYVPPTYESEQSFAAVKNAIGQMNNQQFTNQPINK